MSSEQYILGNLEELFNNHPSQKDTQIENFNDFEQAWNALWEELNNLRIPTMYEAPENSAIKIPDWLFSINDLRTILQNRAKLNDTQMPLYSPYFRVFVDPENNDTADPAVVKGSLRNLEKEKMRQDPPNDNDATIEDYAKRIFGSNKETGKLNKCGIIINTATKFHSGLAEKLKIVYEQLKLNMNVQEDEFLELDATIFMGNYGYTPLGIHQDRGFADGIIHFQCTPESGSGAKVMHLWGEKEYKDLTDIGDYRFFGQRLNEEKGIKYESMRNFLNVSLENSKKENEDTNGKWKDLKYKYRGFEISPKNVFLLPGKTDTPYHVGETHNFSIGFTILFTKWHKGHPEVFKSAMNAYLRNINGAVNDYYTNDNFSVNKQTIIDNYVNEITSNYGFEPFDERIK